MGFGLPAAMGVQFAHPDAVVACVTGEGSFMMNMQELSTCLQYGLPIKIINLNNQALGMVKQWQDMQYGGRHSQSTYSDSLPDFKTLVEAFGHVGFKVERAEDLEPVMREAFGDRLKRRTVFVDVWVDPSSTSTRWRSKAAPCATCTWDGPSPPSGKGRCLPAWGRGRVLMRHIIAVLLENEAGALSRVVGCSPSATTTSRA
jgi:thiamine pyrophosphate-dependent acetolactate synthase large subunit-like protein